MPNFIYIRLAILELSNSPTLFHILKIYYGWLFRWLFYRFPIGTYRLTKHLSVFIRLIKYHCIRWFTPIKSQYFLFTTFAFKQFIKSTTYTKPLFLTTYCASVTSASVPKKPAAFLKSMSTANIKCKCIPWILIELLFCEGI